MEHPPRISLETSEEKQAALEKVKANIIDIFQHIRDAISEGLALLDDLAEELKNSPDATARALGEVLDKIVSALSWFTNPENWETVVKAFEALIAVWATGKAANAVGKIASFAANVMTIKNGGRWLLNGASGFSTAAGTAASLTGSEVTAAITAAAGPLATAIAGITMSVGVVAMAVPVIAALGEIVAGRWPSWLPDIRNNATDTLLSGFGESARKRIGEILSTKSKAAPTATGRDIWALYNGTYEAEEKTAADYMPQTSVQWGARIPSMTRGPNKIEATAEQRAAAETFWDVWRSSETGVSEYSAAYEALKETYEGNIEELDYLMEWMERLYNAMEENMASDEAETGAWEDLPSSWWLNNNSLTSDDISGFRSMPGQMRAAVKEGVSGIKVTMDGQIVGSLVAPYVSQYIARDIV